MAVGTDVQANFDVSKIPDRSLAALTDGRNLYGSILPIREWFSELARRHDLETERPLVQAELNLRYQRQTTNLNRLSWLAGLLAAETGRRGVILNKRSAVKDHVSISLRVYPRRR